MTSVIAQAWGKVESLVELKTHPQEEQASMDLQLKGKAALVSIASLFFDSCPDRADTEQLLFALKGR